MRPTVSVIIPTLGRETLTRTLQSCQNADEVIVVADAVRGNLEKTVEITNAIRPDAKLAAIHIAPMYDVGYMQREVGLGYATKTHVAFMDDDDVYTEDAFELMREHADEVPVIFRMRWINTEVVWTEPVVEYANVGTPMFLVPNVREKMGRWKAHIKDTGFGRASGGDYTYIKETVEQMGGVKWREEVIAHVRP